MGKVALFMMVSLDGYMEGLNHDLSWHNVDDEFNEFAATQLDEASTLVFGKKTYEMMAEFWPSQYAIKSGPVVAGKMNNMPKIVFSHRLKRADWDNTQVLSEIKELSNLKKNSSKDLLVLGSNNLGVSLLQMDLLDKIRIMINPVIIGSGTALFKGLSKVKKLKLASSRSFRSGNVLLYLRPEVK